MTCTGRPAGDAPANRACWSRGRPVSSAQDACLRADPDRLAPPISAGMTSAVKGRRPGRPRFIPGAWPRSRGGLEQGGEGADERGEGRGRGGPAQAGHARP